MPLALLTLAAALGALYWYIQRHAGASDAGSAPADGLAQLTAEVDASIAQMDSSIAQIGAGVDASLAGIDTAFSSGGESLLASFGVTMKNAFTLPASAEPYADQIAAASAAQGLPDGLLARVLYQESRFRADIISGATVSSAGALGIAQFMPGTARDLNVDPLNTREAIPGAAKYLKQLFDQLGTWTAAVAAYNWGPGNVQRKGLAAAPAETRTYVASIMGDLPDLS